MLTMDNTQLRDKLWKHEEIEPFAFPKNEEAIDLVEKEAALEWA